MDRGIPTEEVLAEMRASETPMYYLVGTPRGRLSKMEQDFVPLPWTLVRDSVQTKLVEQDGELYVLARSATRRDKEQAIRRRRLRKLASSTASHASLEGLTRPIGLLRLPFGRPPPGRTPP
jgi:hypothetical protein